MCNVDTIFLLYECVLCACVLWVRSFCVRACLICMPVMCEFRENIFTLVGGGGCEWIVYLCVWMNYIIFKMRFFCCVYCYELINLIKFFTLLTLFSLPSYLLNLTWRLTNVFSPRRKRLIIVQKNKNIFFTIFIEGTTSFGVQYLCLVHIDISKTIEMI